MTHDDAPTIEDFPIRTYDKLRYADTDKQGHINNAVYSTFYETGRVEFIAQAEAAAEQAGTEFVIAQITITYIAEIHWPGTVEIGARVKKVGNSSLVVEQAVFHEGRLCSRAESVVVQISTATRSSTPFDDGMRAYFATITADRD